MKNVDNEMGYRYDSQNIYINKYVFLMTSVIKWRDEKDIMGIEG